MGLCVVRVGYQYIYELRMNGLQCSDGIHIHRPAFAAKGDVAQGNQVFEVYVAQVVRAARVRTFGPEEFSINGPQNIP